MKGRGRRRTVIDSRYRGLGDANSGRNETTNARERAVVLEATPTRAFHCPACALYLDKYLSKNDSATMILTL